MNWTLFKTILLLALVLASSILPYDAMDFFGFKHHKKSNVKLDQVQDENDSKEGKVSLSESPFAKYSPSIVAQKLATKPQHLDKVVSNLEANKYFREGLKSADEATQNSLRHAFHNRMTQSLIQTVLEEVPTLDILRYFFHPKREAETLTSTDVNLKERPDVAVPNKFYLFLKSIRFIFKWWVFSFWWAPSVS